MSATRLMPYTGTLETPDGGSTKDDYNNDVPTTATTTVLCGWDQNQQGENTVDTAQQAETVRIFIEAGAVATAASVLTVGDDVFQLAGIPWKVQNKRTGAVSHLEVLGRQVR